MTQEPATQAGPRIDRVPSPVIGTEAGRALIGASLWDELGLGMTGSRWLARSIEAIEAEAAKRALQEAWDIGDKLDSNHARWAAARAADIVGATIDHHNRFSEPPRNRNEEEIARLERELQRCQEAPFG